MQPRHILVIGLVFGLCACGNPQDTGKSPAASASAADQGLAATGTATTSQPALTAQTVKSGGVMPEAQQRVHFDHAELHFTVDPARQRIDGDARLTFTAKQAISEVLLDLDRNLPISRVAVDDQPLAPSAWSNPDGQLRIQLPTGLAPGGKVTVRVAYGGRPHVAQKAPWDGGFVWTHTADGQPWVGVAVEGEGCDLFWPCIDYPEGEPDLVDTYVTVPKPLVAPGNGVLVGVTETAGQRTWHWRARQPDTYAVTLNIGPYRELKGDYHSRYGNVIPMAFWYLPGKEAQAKELFATLPSILDFFEQEIGPYPFGDEKVGMVESPYYGMEHQTINAYGAGYPKDKYDFDFLLQHEFAHEWFGNQLTNADWDDMWLHEGFGSYMQPLYGRYLHGDMAYYAMLHDMRIGLMNRLPVVSGHSQTEEAVYDKDHGPGNDIYAKGALVLHSLRELIGDDAFFKSTRLLVYGRDDPKPGNFKPRYSTTRDFMDIVNKVTGKNLDWFFKVYLYQAKLPRLDVQRDADTLKLHWMAPQGLPFPMPVEVQVGYQVRTLPMGNGRGELKVPAGTLVIVDPHSKLLREEPYIPAYQEWKKQDALDAKKPGYRNPRTPATSDPLPKSTGT
jgi:aminopeptidase N